MKPTPFKPTHVLSRLEAVTITSATMLSKLEADVAWYKSALEQKTAWTLQLKVEMTALKAENLCLRILLIVLGCLASATSLALCWL